MTAYAWRFALRSESGPGASSTTKELVPGKRWFCQLGAVPCGQRIFAKSMLEKRANFLAAGTLWPQARTRVCGWWYQMVSSGFRSLTSLRTVRVSGSDQGRGPEYSGSQRLPIGIHSEPKFRFRSTPRPFCRTPSSRPSGLTQWITHRSKLPGGLRRVSLCVTAPPAHSFPWMHPTTSTLCGLEASPRRCTLIGRSWVEWPTTAVSVVGAAVASASAERRISMPIRSLVRGPPAGRFTYPRSADNLPDRRDVRSLRLHDAVGGDRDPTPARSRDPVARFARTWHAVSRATRSRSPVPGGRLSLLHLGPLVASPAGPIGEEVGDRSPCSQGPACGLRVRGLASFRAAPR